MKDTETGDSLCDPDHPALLERMRFPDPVISVSVEPKTRDDVDKMSTALYKMAKADPSLRLEVDQETGQTVLRGMGELHLEVTIDRMRTELGVEANMGKPQGQLPRSLRHGGRAHLHAQEAVRRLGPVRRSEDGVRAARGRQRRRVLRRSRRRAHPARIHPVGRARDPHREQAGPGRRLRSRRLQGAADRRQVPRRRQFGAGVRDRRPRLLPRSRTRRASRSCSSRS